MNRLVNMMVLVHIGLICIALLLPAINKIKGDVDRILCANSMRQIVTALHNHAGARGGALPIGADERFRDIPVDRRYSWLVLTEPYIQASDRYKRFMAAKTWDDPEIRYLVLVVDGLHPCPGNPIERTPTHEAVGHYIGIAGIGPDSPELPKDHPRAGVFGYERRFRLDDAKKKGTANIMAIAETATDNGPWVAGGFATVRGIDLTNPPYFGPAGQFSSRHGRISNAVFLDNSVRAFTDGIDPNVLRQLATVNVPRDGDQ